MLSKPLASKYLLSLLAILASSAYANEQTIQNKPSNSKYQKEKICAIYPHLKDSYWLSVNYGMVSEAENQQVELRVLEAGGYPNVNKQTSQLVLCTKWGADAIILGTVSPDAYRDNLSDWVGSTPVFATVNELVLNTEQQKILKGTVGVDWYQMGFQVGEYLAKLHPKGSGNTPIALLLGPQASGGTKPVALGFYDAIQSSDVTIAVNYWADNDKELQRNLVQQVIEQPNIKYIVGSAVAIEAAISELRAAGKTNDIGLISSYLSHGVYRGLLRNKVLFAPTDKMVAQGRLSVKQAVSYLRDQPYKKHSVPTIEALTPTTLKDQVIADSLSPSEFRPVFSVNP
ncbi:TMAO reductase system periplasmic protein TorT [Vibrio artabrorum]|uniref:TMAO reductase system periplasmic protein TorT n=1 Tax=Vibrio artabrorum TaxID=446374 RepID=A0ABT8CKK0_9VIBR|nr:TMAO reductase system periplasmic protein TorT [Vibrio artabrorum]MDN3702272.1 TMAO reductase system periplasmic protein TorT [Vibrio artabrorum]